MKRRHRHLILAAAAIALLGVSASMTSCESTPGGGGAGSGSPVGSLQSQGRHVYLTKCTACHAAEPVGDYTKSEWSAMVAEMREKSKLAPGEERALLAYLRANAYDS